MQQTEAKPHACKQQHNLANTVYDHFKSCDFPLEESFFLYLLRNAYYEKRDVGNCVNR